MRLRLLVPVVFLALAAADAADAARAVSAFATHMDLRLALLALHAVLRTAVALAFAFFTAQRSEPRRRARGPVAFLACAVAMLAVVPVAGPGAGTPSALLLAGDAVAAGGSLWIFASVLALGRCFSVLPEARGLITRGPYRLVRHPVYLGEIVALAGLTIAAPALGHLAILAVFVAAQLTRMRLEEAALTEAFPEYAAYAARTRRLLPAPKVALGVATVAVAVLAVAAIPAQAGARRHHRTPAARRHHRAQVIAGLREPGLQSPANDASVQSLPTFEWAPVANAASYQFELAADPRFGSLVQRALSGQGSLQTHNTAATLDKAVPDGAYWWRVRALTAKGSVGAWSPVRRIVKAWTAAPQITGGDGAAVSWPTTPLVLRWSSVPYATKYVVSIATDPALSNLVLGTASQPNETQGTSFALPVSLAPGSYYWAVTPLDAEGHRGARSRLATFQWTWPTAMTTWVTDLNHDPRVFDPMFSWNPVPGAARYEVEVSTAEEFPAGSKWCCSGTTTGTSLAPLQVLANNNYYWRVRAIDARGNAGVWNYGQSFTKAFDSVTPSIPNLTVRDVNGGALTGLETDVPIVTWDPVPGASRYEVQLGDYNSSGRYCDWTLAGSSGYHADTATTAWTPLARTSSRPFSEAWPSPQQDSALPTGPNATYCVRVLARSDDDAQHTQVTSEWTYLNGYNNPAFTFTTPPTGSTCAITPASNYRLPATGSVTPRTPYFSWEAVPGAGGYYVVIARDAGFTQVVDVGFTDVNAYAPRLAGGTPLSDETTAYYWAVIPAVSSSGAGVCSDPQHNNPQSFDKSSAPPVPFSPANGAVVSTQPTFEWGASPENGGAPEKGRATENARNYRLQVSQDPTFGNPIDDVTTDATAYTSSSTYPADTAIYWRVRANDWNGQGLNWSPTWTFVRRLPVPSPIQDNPTGGPEIPPLSWTPVQGAISYDLHLEEPNGVKKDFTFEAPSATVVKYYGTGIWRWQVRAEFPTGFGGKVAGGYSAPLASLLTLPAPSGVIGVKTGTRLVVSWNPDPAAKQYEVDVSTTDGFLTTVDSHRTDSTSWAPNVDLTAAANRRLLFWRVAAIDEGGNVGAFATGSFGKPPATPRCTLVKRKVKGRSVKVKRCKASGGKRPKRGRH
jgi:protein-S-isoprenylcysteine O-methyltransferase Ste14